MTASRCPENAQEISSQNRGQLVNVDNHIDIFIHIHNNFYASFRCDNFLQNFAVVPERLVNVIDFVSKIGQGQT